MAISLLLADDSPTIAKILSLALQSEAYAIKAVLTAEEALHELKTNPPFFFLCDLSLPAKNGYEFARLIKNDPKLAKVRVVLLASAFEPVDEVLFQDCGADGLVKKPFDPSELRQKLRSIQEAPIQNERAPVTGSLSGFMVTQLEGTPVNLTAPPAEELPPPSLDLGGPSEEPVDLSSLLSGTSPAEVAGGDADAILAGILGGGDAPPKAPPKAAAPTPSSLPPSSPPSRPLGNVLPDQPSAPSLLTGTTVVLDLSGNEMAAPPPEALPAGISASFTTPPGGTAIIDLSLLGEERPSGPPASPPAASAPSPAEEPLSANAQALAAFFAAEIQSQGDKPPETPPASAPPKSSSPPKAFTAPTPAPTISPSPDDGDFESSIGSIDWGEGPAKESLNAWSSSQPKGAPASAPRKAPASTDAPPPFAPKAPAGGGASSSAHGSLMFDTGSSSFRFSDDYVTRITKSFTGAQNEEVPQKHAPVFAAKSDDRAPLRQAEPHAEAASTPSSGFAGGTWSDADMAKIEQIVREEVQMVVREVAEKIAWEVIPELAENIIRKELDKVLKEMEPN